jgi:hypothetical protein
MFNIFNSNVLIEVGEAIGNIKQKLTGGGHGSLVDDLYQKQLEQPSRFTFDPDEVIDGEFRVLPKEDEL